MRIIAGSAKGKTLLSPPDARTRPTSDRAREGLFSSLESEFGSINDLAFLDLFAGSGADGVEALSRGATLVHAVESNSEMSRIASANFELVKSPVGKFKVIHSSAKKYLDNEFTFHQAPESGFDIIFMDPPYELPNSDITDLLLSIVRGNLLKHYGIIAIERETKSKPFEWPEGMEEIKVRSYGQGSIYYGGYSASVLP